MAQTPVADRLYLARLLAREARSRARGALARVAGLASRLRWRSPDRLLLVPPDIRTADPTIANDIYGGFFVFAGKMVNTHGVMPFDVDPASPAWLAGLAGFGWLRHLRAADTALARAHARSLVTDWLAVSEQGRHAAHWAPRVAARRLLSFISQSPLLLEGVDGAFYRRFMKSLGRHAAVLQGALRRGLEGEDRILALVALAELGLCAEGLDKLQRKATRMLASELARQFLPDGGHVSRDPRAIVDLLLDLLPLRHAYAARGLAAPTELLNAIDRMLPMLRLFRLGDGSLALFNGMGVTSPHHLTTALSHDDARAAALLDAPYSGYQRLEGDDVCLVMDTGAPPPPVFSARAHAGCLSFEFSAQGLRLVVNCGAPAIANPEMRAAARSTAAHSTLVVADTSSCGFATGAGLSRWIEGRVVRGPRDVRVLRQEHTGHVEVVASHDGYARNFGLVHRRAVSLSRDGRLLRGEDSLLPDGAGAPPAHPFAIRFHMHPATRVATTGDDRVVVIALSNGERWLFRASAAVQIEESIYFASVDRPRGADQIVIHANTGDTPMVEWSFERLSASDDIDAAEPDADQALSSP